MSTPLIDVVRDALTSAQRDHNKPTVLIVSEHSWTALRREMTAELYMATLITEHVRFMGLRVAVLLGDRDKPFLQVR